MTDSQLKAILTMLALNHVPITRMPKDMDNSWCIAKEIPMDERILEAEKLAEKVLGRMG